MHKRILLLLCLILVPSSVFAESKESSGIWITKHYIDDFGLPTDEAYISTEKKIKGTFSNTATTDDLLYVTPLLDDNVCFQLWEYGDRLVKGYQSKGHEYSIVVLAPDQTKTEMKGIMKNGGDRIILYKEYVPAFYDILNQNGSVSVLLKHGTSKYLFTFEDTTGIAEVYLNSFENMPHHRIGTASEIEVTLSSEVRYSISEWYEKYIKYMKLTVTTNLPNGTVLDIHAKSGSDDFDLVSGTVSNGSCEIERRAIADRNYYANITATIKYGKQTDEFYELYGDSFEKLTGEVSDGLKTGYSLTYYTN